MAAVLLKFMPIILQIAAMLIDLIVLAAVVVVYYYGGFIPAVIGAAMAHLAMRDVGGWFFAWRPSSIRAFFTNWRKNI